MTQSTRAVQTDSQSTTSDDIHEDPCLHNNLSNESRLRLSNSSSTTNSNFPSGPRAEGDDSNAEDRHQGTGIRDSNADATKSTVEPENEERNIDGFGTYIGNKYFQLCWIMIFCFGMIVTSVMLFIYFYDALVRIQLD